MWVFTVDGFFSAVKKDDGMNLRFRSEDQAKAIRSKYDILKGKQIREYGQADYRWRIVVDRSTFVDLMADIADDVDYDNFKSAATAVGVRGEGGGYIGLLHEVWSSHFRFQQDNEIGEPRYRPGYFQDLFGNS